MQQENGQKKQSKPQIPEYRPKMNFFIQHKPITSLSPGSFYSRSWQRILWILAIKNESPYSLKPCIALDAQNGTPKNEIALLFNLPICRQQKNINWSPIRDLTFPSIFLFERSPDFLRSQSPILSSAIIIKTSLLKK